MSEEKCGVLILAHGSKREQTQIILNSLAQKTRERFKDAIICTAYLQLCEPLLEQAISDMAAQQITQIKIIPLFLFDGVHVTQDIPYEIEQISKRYPALKISMSKHIGDDDRIVDIILDRIQS